eukprot:c4537_g1_i1.p2 GENE.c4537_g1_i1~~c4537_g1_i1.p2  ORF type:complete len:110 (+),score=32.77 c4537_g1_i1:263-592(+)
MTTLQLSWHTDEDIPLYGVNPAICSLSFGAARDFLLRSAPPTDNNPNTNTNTNGNTNGMEPKRLVITLTHGSMLVMKGATQTYFQHCVRKRRETEGPRINLTFRTVLLS